MASIRSRKRAGGSTAYAVLYKHRGQQTSATFDTEESAEEFRAAVDSIGAEKAMKGWGIAPTERAMKRSTAPTVADWCRRYIASRTGVAKSTLYDYNSYLARDIQPNPIATIPIDLLTPDDVAAWVQTLTERGLSGKTIANRHGFLSAALNTAVKASEIPSNPAEGTRLPRTEKREMLFLDRDEFDLFESCFTPRWRPLVRFLISSGARFGEVAGLTPEDVDRRHGTVHIGAARKRTYDEDRYEIGPTKTRRSDRTINVPRSLLNELDYSHEYLFVNTVGKPLDISSFRNNVWYPAVKRAQAKGLRKKPRIHDMRHSCVSWLIQSGTSLPEIQRHLGHENIGTTVDRYGHLDRKSGQKVAAVFEDFFTRP